MRYYPLHIILKDFFFLLLLFLSDKWLQEDSPSKWWGTKEMVGTALYVGLGFIILNLIIFWIIQLMITVRREKYSSSFWFGAALHLLTIATAYFSLEITNRISSFIIASALSFLISGYIYKKLNSGFSFEKVFKKYAGVE